jgi:hypothetical protein
MPYRWGFERKVFRKCKLEVKRASLVWTVWLRGGFRIYRDHAWKRITHRPFDGTFPVEKIVLGRFIRDALDRVC